MPTSMDKIRGNTDSENPQYTDLIKYQHRGRVRFGIYGKNVAIPYRTNPNLHLLINVRTYLQFANAIDSRLNFGYLLAKLPDGQKLLNFGRRIPGYN